MTKIIVLFASQITTDDPVEVLQARTVAIVNICVEVVGGVHCGWMWCGVLSFLAVLSSSLVACCCKHNVVYTVWGSMGVLIGVMHVVAATEAMTAESEYGDPLILCVAQCILCGISLLVAYIGRKTALAITKRSIVPVETQVGTPLPLMYTVAGAQPSTVTHMLPQSP